MSQQKQDEIERVYRTVNFLQLDSCTAFYVNNLDFGVKLFFALRNLQLKFSFVKVFFGSILIAF